MPPLPRERNTSAKAKKPIKLPGDAYFDDNGTDSIGTILYDTLCPRVPNEGFFGPFNLPYVTKQGAKNLRKYKYSGSDLSPLYIYILSPMADACVRVLPRSIAPNLITLTALMISIYNHLVIAYYSWDLEQQVPEWVWIQNGISLLLYQLLDNMDGKQARRTKTSSPLGMVFDHGCDALNSGMLAMNNLAILRLGDEQGKSLLIYFFLITPFLLSTWEELFSGSLVMPFPNGASEGILFVAGLSFLAALLGPNYVDFWDAEIQLIGWKRITILIGVFGVCSSLTIIHNVRAVIAALKPAAFKNETRTLRRRDAFGAILPLLFGHVLTGIILYLPDTSLYLAHPRIFIALLNIIFANLAIHLQLAHIQAMTFYPWRKTFILPLFVLTANAIFQFFGIHLVDPSILLYICCVGAAFSIVQFICRILVELSTALGINVFTLPPTT